MSDEVKVVAVTLDLHNDPQGLKHIVSTCTYYGGSRGLNMPLEANLFRAWMRWNDAAPRGLNLALAFRRWVQDQTSLRGHIRGAV